MKQEEWDELEDKMLTVAEKSPDLFAYIFGPLFRCAEKEDE